MSASGTRSSFGSTPANVAPGASGGASAANRYEVLERVGEGTLWVVYRVRDRQNGQVCTLKALKGAFARHGTFAEALARAATQTLGWNHPHVAQLFEVGREEGTPFLVSEWLPGPSLETRVKRAPFSESETLHWANQIAAALQYLHGEGAAHGDLRPRQMMLATATPSATRNGANRIAAGALKLTDAGLSPAFTAAGLALPDVHHDSIYYLAPECCDGAPAAPPTDIYALGVVLYRMLSGRTPFDGSSQLAVATKHRSEGPVRPSQWNQGCSPALEALTLQCLHKDPASRPAAADVLRALQPAAAPDAAQVAPQIAPVAAVAAPIAAASQAAPIVPQTAPQAAIAAVTVDPPDDIAIEKKARKKHRRREALGAFLAFFWMLIAAGLLGGIFYGAYYFWLKESPRTVQIPAYIGKSQADAENLLTKRGLVMKVGGTRFDPRKPEGTVIAGDQPTGKPVKIGREVYVIVSQGQEPIKMPDFTELSLPRARQIIAREGMRLGQVADRYDNRIPQGYICDQFPAPGEMFRLSDPLNLVVSKGPQPRLDDNSEPLPPAATAPAPAPDDADSPNAPLPPQVTMISRALSVRVQIPANGQAQEVRVVVHDSTGEHTVYKRTHQPGDLVDETIQVTRQQGTTATVRVYVGDTLFSESRV